MVEDQPDDSGPTRVMPGFRRPVPYAVATDQAVARKDAGGGHDVANPGGTWHAVDPATGELMCQFVGAVYVWKGYDFGAFKHAARCPGCIVAVESAAR